MTSFRQQEWLSAFPTQFHFLFLTILLCNDSDLCSSATRLNQLDCSSEDEEADEAEDNASRDFLESFQRSKIKQKMQHKSKGKPRRGSRVQPEDEGPKFQEEIFREFVLQNKAPFWNELSQVYQLDFGGRVTQESAKNFQIEHQANQVRHVCSASHIPCDPHSCSFRNKRLFLYTMLSYLLNPAFENL